MVCAWERARVCLYARKTILIEFSVVCSLSILVSVATYVEIVLLNTEQYIQNP